MSIEENKQNDEAKIKRVIEGYVEAFRSIGPVLEALEGGGAAGEEGLDGLGQRREIEGLGEHPVGTGEPSGCEVSWRMASTSPRKPPAAPAWPTESWPPEVLWGKEPSLVKLW